MLGKALWHHVRDSFFHFVMHHAWVLIAGEAVSILAIIWALMKHASPLVNFAMGVALTLLVVLSAAAISHVKEERKQETPEMRRRRKEISRYTSDGISWERTDPAFVYDRAEETIIIRPTNTGGELPQPIEFKIACAGIAEVLDVRHYPSGGNAGIHQWEPDNTGVLLRLVSPRLYGEAYISVRLRSIGSGMSVMNVKRNAKPLRPI